MKYLLFWLPIAAVVLASLMVHGPVVDAWHDWTTGWHRYQLVALGQVAGLAIGVWCVVVLLVNWLAYELPANRRQRRQP
jgi:hypothetical protein